MKPVNLIALLALLVGLARCGGSGTPTLEQQLVGTWNTLQSGPHVFPYDFGADFGPLTETIFLTTTDDRYQMLLTDAVGRGAGGQAGHWSLTDDLLVFDPDDPYQSSASHLVSLEGDTLTLGSARWVLPSDPSVLERLPLVSEHQLVGKWQLLYEGNVHTWPIEMGNHGLVNSTIEISAQDHRFRYALTKVSTGEVIEEDIRQWSLNGNVLVLSSLPEWRPSTVLLEGDRLILSDIEFPVDSLAYDRIP